MTRLTVTTRVEAPEKAETTSGFSTSRFNITFENSIDATFLPKSTHSAEAVHV